MEDPGLKQKLVEKAGSAFSNTSRLPDGVEYVCTNDQGLREFLSPSDNALMVHIPPGSFLMGSTAEEAVSEYRLSNLCGAAREEWFLAETPPHEERVERLLVDKYEVTNRQFSRFVDETRYRTEAEELGHGMRWDVRTQKWKRAKNWDWRRPAGDRADFPTGPDFPAVQLTWEDAVAYSRWAGKRLPTEVEWEYVCRAGAGTRYYWGDDPNYEDINHNAWYIGNAGGRTHEVGRKRPNAWGLHDMSGNVWEWVSGCYTGYPGTCCNGMRFGEERRVLRGGAWYFHPAYLRSAYRGTAIKGNFTGFRCVMDVPKQNISSRT